MGLLYSSLTEPQRRVVTTLAVAQIDDPPGWVPLEDIPARLNRLTIRKLVNLDLIVVSKAKVDTRLKITGRGLRYYEDVICNPPDTGFTDDEIRAMIRMADKGAAYHHVAEKFGCSPAMVGLIMRGAYKRYRRILDEVGVTPVQRNARHDLRLRAKVVEMRKRGASYALIQDETGVPRGTIGKWLQDEGYITEGWLNDDQRREIVRMAQGGMSYEQIADAIGRSVRPVKEAMAAFYNGVLKVE